MAAVAAPTRPATPSYSRPRPASSRVKSCRAVEGPATRARSQPVELRDLLAQRQVPIWLGPSRQHEVEDLAEVQDLVDPEMAASPTALEVTRLEREATALASARKYVQAASCLELAIILRRRLLGDEDEGVLLALERAASLFNSWGVDFLKAGHYAASLELLKKVQTYMEAEATPHFPRRVMLHITSLYNLACYFRARGKTHAALQFMEKAWRMEQRARECEDPARMRINHGVLLSGMGRHTEAMHQLSIALAVLQSVDFSSQREGEPDANLHEAAVELVVAHHNMWVELARAKRGADPSSGLDHLRRAANIAEQMLGESYPLTLKMLQSLQAAQECLEEKEGTIDYSVDPSVTVASRLPYLTSIHDAGSSMQEGSMNPPRPSTAGYVRPVCDDPPLPQARPSTSTPSHPCHSRLRPASPRRLKAFSSALSAQGGANRGKGPCITHNLSATLQDMWDQAHSDRRTLAAPAVSHAWDDCGQDSPLPPRPATVAACTRDQMDDDEDFMPDIPRVQRPQSGVAHVFRRGSKAPPEPAPSPSRAPHAGPPDAQLTYREYYNAVRVAEEYDADSARRQRVEVLTRPVTPHQTVPARLCPSPGGPYKNTRNAAYRMVYEARRSYVRERAALKIQKTARGYIHRRVLERHLRELANAHATIIQSHFRRYIAGKKHQIHVVAAIRIQAWWKPRLAQRWLLAYALGIYTAQRLVRGHLARVHVRRWRQAVLRLQRCGRGYMGRKRVKKLRAARNRVQVAVLGWHQQVAFRRKKAAVIRIAASWRGHFLRRKFFVKHVAARTIQVAWRRWAAANSLLLRNSASSRIAAAWLRFQQSNLKRPLVRVCQLQAWWRGLEERRRLHQWPIAATRLQAAWRGWCTRFRWQVFAAKALVLQKHIRRYLDCRRSHAFAAAVVSSQRIYRGCKTRLRLNHLDSAARQIQAFWRGCVARWSCQRDSLKAAIVLQRSCRKVLLSKKLARKRRAQLTIASWWRSSRIQAKWNQTKAAVALIARCSRGFQARARNKKRAAAANRIQRAWRKYCWHLHQDRREAAVVALQAAIRVWLEVRHSKLKRDAATKIQATWRCLMCRRKEAERRLAVRKMQAFYRGSVARKRVRRIMHAAVEINRACALCLAQKRLETMHSSATIIQAGFQATVARQQLRGKERAAVGMQKAYRGWLSRQQAARRRAACLLLQKNIKAWVCQKRHHRKKLAAVAIQAVLRSRRCRAHHCRVLQAVDTLAIAWRWFCSRQREKRRHRAALRIQAIWRGAVSRSRVRQRGAAAMRIQSQMRRCLVLQQLSSQRWAAVVVQKYWRRQLALQAWGRLRGMHDATLHLARCHDARRTTSSMRASASRIGSVARGHLHAQDAQRRQAAACRIQRVIRRHLVRCNLEMKGKSATQIQQALRQQKAIRIVEFRRQEVVEQAAREAAASARALEHKRQVAAVQLQSFLRMHQASKHYRVTLRRAVLTIQAFSRGSAARRNLRRRAIAALRLQSWWRCCTVPKLWRRHHAARKIQHAIRRYLARKRSTLVDVHRYLAAAELIRDVWRSSHAQRKSGEQKKAAARIQAAVRGHATRLKLHKEANAATRIQNGLHRRRLGVRKAEKRHGALVKLQAFQRQVTARRRCDRRLAAVVKIQALARQRQGRRVVVKRQVAAARIQATYRMWNMCRSPPATQRYGNPVARRRAAMKLQAIFRGHLTRSWLQRNHEEARRIQAKMRQHLQRKRWIRARAAIQVIQAAWRGASTRKRLLLQEVGKQKALALAKGTTWRICESPRTQKAAVEIQRRFRGTIARCKYAAKGRACVRLQSAWRCFRARMHYMRILEARLKLRGLIYMFRCRKYRPAALNLNAILGRVFRATRPLARQRRIKFAAVTIQRVFRGSCARQALAHRLMSAKRIQALARMALVQTALKRQRLAALILQARARSWNARRSYCRRIQAIVKIQAFVRAVQAQRVLHAKAAAALKISRRYRTGRCRLAQAKQRRGATAIQAAVRCLHAKAAFQRRIIAARRIQRSWRGHASRRHTRAQHLSATRLAAAFRCYSAHKRFAAQQCAGTTLVRAVFMWRHMHRRRLLKVASTRICAVWRGHVARQSLYCKMGSIQRIQRWWRNMLACALPKSVLAEVCAAKASAKAAVQASNAVIIQRSWRAHWRKKRGFRLVKRMVLSLQARHRRWLRQVQAAIADPQRTRFCVADLPSEMVLLHIDGKKRLTRHRRPSAGRIRSIACLVPLEDKLQVKLHPIQACARIVCLQALPRAAKHKLETQLERIQAFVKHRLFLKRVVRIQSVMRGWLSRRQNVLKHRSVVRIQAHWRGTLVRRSRLSADTSLEL
mmetsp:Transcript_36859/g.84983  ORF Transcript_36859/g.84983 Transcript_36859/m.84983 type:complete len:2322 (-) Transcript_36859:49-7014(-)